MKLNTSHRTAFIRAVMDDVPKHDYCANFQKLIKDDMLEIAPAVIRPLLQTEDLNHYILTGYRSVAPPAVSVENHHYSGWEVSISSVTVYNGYEMSPAAKTEAQAIMTQAVVQKRRRELLRNQVAGAINSCSTLKQAHERLPEFAKYLPAEGVKALTLPAIANLAADLVKAGWPKEKEAVAA